MRSQIPMSNRIFHFISVRRTKNVVYFIVATFLVFFPLSVVHAAIQINHYGERNDINLPNMTDTLINFGETVNGSIDIPGEEDIYTFSGNIGDVIIVRMIDSPNTGFGSEISLYRPNGTLLCSDWDVGGSLAETTCTLDIDGTFTILAEDHFGFTTGTYGLHIQRLNQPGNATSLEFGDTVTHTITLPSEMIAYTLTGIENDVVDLRMINSPNTGFGSEIRLYRPDGSLLCSYWDLYGSMVETACSLDTGGTFTILAGDHYGFTTGTYGLHVQRLNQSRKRNLT